MKNTSLLTIIRKHSPTADSKGLILSANLAQGSGKKLFALDKFDTWDLRVDGPVLSLQSLETYRSRVIHILADENSQIDSQTMSVLKQLVDKNGSLSVWGSRLDRSQMGQSLLKLAGVGLTSVQNFTGDAIGIERLKGLSLPLQGVISILNSQSPKANYVLNSSVGTLGLLTFGNAMEDRTGQILTVGMDLTDLSNESALQILSQFERVRLSTDSKIKLVMEKPSENINLLAHDLFDELVGAELLGSGSFYKNNSEKNKIFRAGKRLIGDAGRKSAQARELSKLYPALMNTISTRLSREKWFAEQVLEKRHGNFVNSRSIKDIFCENNPQNQLCQAPVN